MAAQSSSVSSIASCSTESVLDESFEEFMIDKDGDGGSEIALAMTRMHFTCIYRS